MRYIYSNMTVDGRPSGTNAMRIETAKVNMCCLAFVNGSDADNEEHNSKDDWDGRKQHHKAGATDSSVSSLHSEGFKNNIHFYCQRRLFPGLTASELRDLTCRRHVR
jgi:hypothetical protein